MRVLVTGSAGFIGSEVALKLLARGDFVVGIDNHNDYYDPALKEARLERFINHPNYVHLRSDISNKSQLMECYSTYNPESTINLAAQAGVRYSIENPEAYIQSNVVGFANILECCRIYHTRHLVYASSSSVYGANPTLPFSVHDNVDHPLSLYAGTKKANELMAHSYSHLFGIPTTGLRFFTVYGPWGRPDMALFKFTESILKGRKIPVYNFGKHKRDFTFVDDVVDGILKVLDKPPKKANTDDFSYSPATSAAPWRVYNIGNSKPVELMKYIKAIESALDIKADVDFLPMQPGDVADTHADVSDLIETFNYRPTTDIVDGVKMFVKWYREYFGIN